MRPSTRIDSSGPTRDMVMPMRSQRMRGPAFIEILVILALAATIISVLLQRR